MAFKKSYRKKSTKRTYKRKSYARKGKSTPMRKVIRREIARTEEVKAKQQFVSLKQLWTTGNVNFPNNVVSLGPQPGSLPINQGTGQGDRIGNKIMTKKLTFKGVITPVDWDTTLNPNPRPLQVKMVLLYDREDPNDPPIPGSTFFQDGGSTTGFTGTQMDLIKPYNEDRYRILMTKTWKLGFASYTGTASSSANQLEWQAYSNNDFKLNINFNIDVTKYYPKQVKFNDNNSTPMNRGLFALFYCISADGTVMPAAWQPAWLTFMQDYRFTDA